LNRGRLTPSPQLSPGIFGFPQINLPGLVANTPSQFTPWGLLVLTGVPQSPLVAS
jgi:hypothetical protein